MRFDIITIFPEFFDGPLDYGIVRRAREAGLVDVAVHDLRAWTHDRHATVDDRPFGGGEGMVLKPDPIFEAVESLLDARNNQSEEKDDAEAQGTQRSRRESAGAAGAAIMLLSASGKLFRQPEAKRLAALDRVVLVCGRYEGVDERVAEHLASDELSIGDFVLSGGELAAAVVVDATTRLLPGALGNEASSVNESFNDAAIHAPAVHRSLSMGIDLSAVVKTDAGGILDCPHFTRPAEFRGWKVPDTLIGGNHAQIARWRRKMALAKTQRNRPDLLANAMLCGTLGDDDLRLLEELKQESSR
ncbi:MAG TPA: tRNA (guanosine(37)-N1)-methyltransferase TrmD [Candidatus Acidoferrales bacterium]